MLQFMTALGMFFRIKKENWDRAVKEMKASEPDGGKAYDEWIAYLNKYDVDDWQERFLTYPEPEPELEPERDDNKKQGILSLPFLNNLSLPFLDKWTKQKDDTDDDDGDEEPRTDFQVKPIAPPFEDKGISEEELDALVERKDVNALKEALEKERTGTPPPEECNIDISTFGLPVNEDDLSDDERKHRAHIRGLMARAEKQAPDPVLQALLALRNPMSLAMLGFSSFQEGLESVPYLNTGFLNRCMTLGAPRVDVTDIGTDDEAEQQKIMKDHPELFNPILPPDALPDRGLAPGVHPSPWEMTPQKILDRARRRADEAIRITEEEADDPAAQAAEAQLAKEAKRDPYSHLGFLARKELRQLAKGRDTTVIPPEDVQRIKELYLQVRQARKDAGLPGDGARARQPGEEPPKLAPLPQGSVPPEVRQEVKTLLERYRRGAGLPPPGKGGLPPMTASLPRLPEFEDGPLIPTSKDSAAALEARKDAADRSDGPGSGQATRHRARSSKGYDDQVLDQMALKRIISELSARAKDARMAEEAARAAVAEKVVEAEQVADTETAQPEELTSEEPTSKSTLEE